MIQAIVEEELETALGAGKSERVGSARSGYRHGSRERQHDQFGADHDHDAAGSSKG